MIGGRCLLQLQGSWRATLLCAEGKKALRWLKRPVETILLFHLVIVVVIVAVAVANHVDRQEMPSGEGGGERTSKEYKDFQPKFKKSAKTRTLRLQCLRLAVNMLIA